MSPVTKERAPHHINTTANAGSSNGCTPAVNEAVVIGKIGHRRTVARATTVATTSRVTLPVFTVPAVIVDGKRVGGVQEGGGGGERGGLRLCRRGLSRACGVVRLVVKWRGAPH